MGEENKNVTNIIKQRFLDDSVATVILIGVLSILFAGTPDLADAIMFYLTDGTFPSIEAATQD